jgi:predicted membrane-bound spermidine synthase
MLEIVKNKSYPPAIEIVTISRSSLALTSVLFFGSGVAALLYQIAWQRMLFGWYGVDLDSVSAIVSIFMLGLGLGALTGGWLADRFQRHRIFIFSLIELTIAIFGIFSLDVIDSIGSRFVANSLPYLVILTFVVFIIPTCAMGATLPVLVTELVARTNNVGFSTGSLYFVNTLGAAVGAFAAGFILLPRAGLDGLVTIAAALNFSVSAVAYVAFRRSV